MGSWSNFQEWKENGNCKTIKQFVPSSSSPASDTDHSFQNFEIKSLVCWSKMFHALLVQPSLMIGKQRSRSYPTRRKYIWLLVIYSGWKDSSAVCGSSQTWICQQNLIFIEANKICRHQRVLHWRVLFNGCSRYKNTSCLIFESLKSVLIKRFSNKIPLLIETKVPLSTKLPRLCTEKTEVSFLISPI